MTPPRLSIVFSHRAARQIEEASDWWRKHREGSPEALSEDLVRTLDIIARQPGIGTPAASQRLKGVRRVLFRESGTVSSIASHGGVTSFRFSLSGTRSGVPVPSCNGAGEGRGFASLPAPSPGDVFLDLEKDAGLGPLPGGREGRVLWVHGPGERGTSRGPSSG